MTTPNTVLQVSCTLNQNGFQAWIVGGAVRDTLLGRPAHDWDIATDALPHQVQGLFPSTLGIGAKHGTITVLLDGEALEVTTFRQEGVYTDGRRPDNVTFARCIEDDLARRDFTVNAMAMDPLTGAICDPFGGQADLQAGVLRTVGSAVDRFWEDGLRLLRAIRFSATHNLIVGDDMHSAIVQALPQIASVSAERIRDELLKMMRAETPSSGLRLMASTGMLDMVLPEMVPMLGCTQNRYHEHDVWTHTLCVVDACPQDQPLLRMAALLHDIAKPSTKGVHPKTGDATFFEHEDVGAVMARALLMRLRFAAHEVDHIVHLIQQHLILYVSSWTDSALRRWVRKVGPANIPDLLTLARADIVGKGSAQTHMDGSALDEMCERLANLGPVPMTSRNLAITGQHVMQVLGITPGPQVGRVLAALLDRVTDDPSLNQQETLLRLVPEVVASV